MKKTLGLFAAIIAFSIFGSFTNKQGSVADPMEWKADYAHSSVSFLVAHLGTPLLGTFNKYEIALKFDPAKPESSSLSVTVDMNSVDTRSENRDKHLKEGDYFDAVKYPTAVFKSDKFTKKSEKEYTVTGELTAKGVSRKAEATLGVTVMKDHPYAKDKLLLGLQGLMKIKRTDFKIGGDDTISLGDEVEIVFYGEFNRAK